MLEITGLTVRYDDFTAVDDVTVSAADGEVLCVLGPSGCGKSTLLRAVAGLEPPVAGRVRLDAEDVTDWRPDRRRVGLMFQDHALFPHRTVGDNVAFGLRMRGQAREAVHARMSEVLALVDLEGFADRPVAQLSGGEQQRVALARAIAPQPRLLMLDEPLGSLDRALRDRLLHELPGVFAEIGTTVVYVTHDQEEALTLADRVAVMQAGALVQVDAPEVAWRAPSTEFVASFLGLGPIIDAVVTSGRADTALGSLALSDVPDGRWRLVVLPGAARLPDDGRGPGPGRCEVSTSVEAEVVARRFAGDHLVVRTRTGQGVELVVPVWRLPGPDLGQRVSVTIDLTEVHVLRS